MEKKRIVHKSKEIFISHATVDKPLADAFVDLLQTGINISAEKILCTSLEGLGIPTGKNFVDFIGENIQSARFVIMLITPAYFESSFCLCELGASWALGSDIYPLIVPPLKYGDMEAVLTGIQAGYITENSTLDEMYSRLIQLDLGTSAIMARWTVKRDKFTKNFPTIQQQLKSSTVVKIESHNDLIATYTSALEMITEKEEEIKTLNQKINRLQECKDREEVAKIEREFSSDYEKFEKLVDEFKEALSKLSRPAQTALYYKMREEWWGPRSGFQCDGEMWEKIHDSVERGYIDSQYQFEFAPRQNKVALEKLSQFRNFINKLEEENNRIIEDFEEKYGYPLDLTNRDFWEDYLCVHLYPA